MPGQTTRITNREKAAILMMAAGIETDWYEIYLIAEDKSRKEAEKVKYLHSTVSRWRNSDKVKKCLAEYTKLFADREADARTQGRDEERRRQEERSENETAGKSERTENEARRSFAAVDYYDPKNQRKQINRIIQEAADDPRTQLDAIKAIQQTQRDDRQAAKDNQIQRFYIPIHCAACPLYQKAQKKATK